MAKQNVKPPPQVAVADPLDAVTMTVDEPADALAPSPDAPLDLEPDAPAQPADAKPAAKPEPPPEPPSSAGLARLPHYRFAAAFRTSWGGQMVTFALGDVVSDESYGPGACERFRAAGAALEEVPPPT